MQLGNCTAHWSVNSRHMPVKDAPNFLQQYSEQYVLLWETRKGASEVLMSCFEPIPHYANAARHISMGIALPNSNPSTCSVNKRGMHRQWGCRLGKHLKSWWDSAVPPWILPLKRYNGSTFPHAHGFSYPLLASSILRSWAHLCRTQKKVLQTLQISSCLLPHFPSLVETRCKGSIDRFHKDKECFNINISGQGFDTDKATKKLL